MSIDLERAQKRSEWRSWAALVLSLIALTVSLFTYFDDSSPEPRKQGYQDAE